MNKDTPGGEQMLVAKESFTKEIDGVPRVFIVNQTRLRADHPWLKGIEHLFKPIRAHYEVESATQAPGERRA